MDLLSPVHLAIILIVALLIFGPKRLPELGNGLGKTIRDFRKAMQDNAEGVSNEPPSQSTDQN
jgi:sec-independent protein translocase protein TatA